MTAKLSSESVLTQAAKIISTWKENLDFALGALKVTDLEAKAADITELDTEIDSLRVKLTGLIERRDKANNELNAFNVRARSGFKAVYGADSFQYKQAGGTPTSERKARTARLPKPKDAEI